MLEYEISKIEDQVAAIFAALREANDRIDELTSDVEKRDKQIKDLEAELEAELEAAREDS